MNSSEFEKDLALDPESLDTECVRQPEAFFRWAERSIEAKGKADRLKLKLEVTEAELQIACRKDPDEFDLEGRVTDAAINAAVRAHPNYLKVEGEYQDAREDSAMLDKAVMAMEMKKRMLEALITLHGQSYFAGPSTPRNLGEAWLAQRDASEKKVNIRMRMKRKQRNDREDTE